MFSSAGLHISLSCC